MVSLQLSIELKAYRENLNDSIQTANNAVEEAQLYQIAFIPKPGSGMSNLATLARNSSLHR
jgi:hypothetical protein